MPKHWQSEEVAAACKGYAKATQNPRVGAYQDLGVFTTEIENRMVNFSPRNPAPDTWHLRTRPHIYCHIRDGVFPAFQTFNKSLRHIYACNPTGVTDQKKCNMVVAMYLGKVRKIDYVFKDFDPTTWKLYAVWLAVKHLPKFAYTPPPLVKNGGTSKSSGDGKDSADDFIKIQTGVCTRGTRRGRNSEKAREGLDRGKQRMYATRERQLEDFSKSIASVSVETRDKTRASVLMQALKVEEDPEVKKKLSAKLIELALEI